MWLKISEILNSYMYFACSTSLLYFSIEIPQESIEENLETGTLFNLNCNKILMRLSDNGSTKAEC